MMKKYVSIVTIILSIVFLSACGGSTDESGIFKDIQDVNITDPDNNSTLLATDIERALIGYVLYNDGSSAVGTSNMLWESNETNVSVNYDSLKGNLGLVSNYNGAVTITVSSHEFSDRYEMNVDGIHYLSVVPSEYNVSGSTFNIEAKAIYISGAENNMTDRVTWSTTNSSVATVDSNGLVTVITSGEDFNVSASLLGEQNTTVVHNP